MSNVNWDRYQRYFRRNRIDLFKPNESFAVYDLLIDDYISEVERNKIKNILVVGSTLPDSSERHERYLATKFPNAQVTTIDQRGLSMDRSLMPESNLVQANALNLPFSDKSFDLIVTHGLFGCLNNNDLSSAIQEIDRASSDNCYFLHTVEWVSSLKMLLRVPLNWLREMIVGTSFFLRTINSYWKILGNVIDSGTENTNYVTLLGKKGYRDTNYARIHAPLGIDK